MNSTAESMEPVVITGWGMISPFGMGKAAFIQGMKAGRTAIRPIGLFDAGLRQSRIGAEIPDFQPEKLLGPKGLRLLDRTTRMSLCAAQEALAEAGLVAAQPLDGIAVVLGSMAGSATSLGDFIAATFTKGPRAVNPSLFPNTVANSAASQIAIRYQMTGPNLTLSSGWISALSAFETATGLLRRGSIRAALVGGVEELSPWMHAALDQAGLLSAEMPRPMDRRRSGTVLGEGAAMFVLELAGRARERGARPLAEYAAGASEFESSEISCAVAGDGLFDSIGRTLDQARLGPEAVSFIVAGANGSPAGDAAEAAVLRKVFGKKGRSPPVTCPKGACGECLSADGAIQAACALASLSGGFIPPTVGLGEPDSNCPVECVAGTPRHQPVRTALITLSSPLFQSAAVLLKQLEEHPLTS